MVTQLFKNYHLSTTPIIVEALDDNRFSFFSFLLNRRRSKRVHLEPSIRISLLLKLHEMCLMLNKRNWVILEAHLILEDKRILPFISFSSSLILALPFSQILIEYDLTVNTQTYVTNIIHLQNSPNFNTAEHTFFDIHQIFSYNFSKNEFRFSMFLDIKNPLFIPKIRIFYLCQFMSIYLGFTIF